MHGERRSPFGPILVDETGLGTQISKVKVGDLDGMVLSTSSWIKISKFKN